MEYGIDLAIVMPVYNEEAVLVRVVGEWLAELGKLPVQFCIRIYNDGSTDATEFLLNKLSQENPLVQVMHHANRGHGPTILQGYHQCTDARWILQVDSDNEITASDFMYLWRLRNKAPLIIGRRVERKCSVSRSVISAAAGAFIGLLFGPGHPRDVNCPFRLMDNRVFGPVFHEVPEHNCVPNMVISGLAALRKILFLEVSVPGNAREKGGAPLGGWNMFFLCTKALVHLIRFRIQTRKGQ